MSSDKERPISGHEYDGITELDNDLPVWWLSIFIGTVIFAFIYWLHYEIAGAPPLSQELAASLKKVQEMKGPETLHSEEQLAALFTEVTTAKGRDIFAGKCAVCHRADGGGQIGPNLTDEFWLHGHGERAAIFKTITEGVSAKGMPPWDGVLADEERVAVAAFVYSLKNTNVPNGKPAQGEKAP